MSDDSREENVYMAKLAEQAERYDEVRSMSAAAHAPRETRLGSFLAQLVCCPRPRQISTREVAAMTSL